MSRLPSSRRREAGMTLIVVLILLVVLTLLALTSLRGTLLEQYMSTSQVDRSLSFQAAEAALREGETLASTKPVVPTAGNPCSNGLCPAPVASATPRWLDSDSNWNSWSRAATTTLASVASQPRFIVEEMAVDAVPGSNCTTSGDVSPDAACTNWESRYRITARSGVATGRSEVILQSNIAVP